MASGPGKKVMTLPVFVSDKVLLVYQWPYAGFDLLVQEFGCKRDDLLPLATEDLRGCVSTGLSTAMPRATAGP